MSSGELEASSSSHFQFTPPKFDGTSISASAWLDEFELCAHANGWDDKTMCKFFPLFLKGSVKHWYFNNRKPFSEYLWWSKDKICIRNVFLDNWETANSLVSTLEEAITFSQRSDMPARHYNQTKINLLKKVDPKMQELLQIAYLTSGLLPSIKQKINEMNITNLGDYLRISDSIDASRISTNESRVNLVNSTNAYKKNKHYTQTVKRNARFINKNKRNDSYYKSSNNNHNNKKNCLLLLP